MSLTASLIALSCLWIYPTDPLAGPPECRPLPAAHGNYHLVDKLYGLTTEQAIAASTTPPANLMDYDVPITRELRAWGMRNVAWHLDRMSEFLVRDAGFAVALPRLTVNLEAHYASWGSMKSRSIHLGGAAELTSEIIYHEYGHHIVEAISPGITIWRGTATTNGAGYGIIEAYANHLAFALDDEPRFSEYMHSRKGGTKAFIYGVETDCTMSRCEQRAFTAGESYRAVIVFGALLWDLKKKLGGTESVTLMLDSVRLLDPREKLGYGAAIRALLAADRARNDGRNTNFISTRARARGLD